MGTTSLTFQVSGVSELLGYIDRIQSKMAGLDQSMSKAQLSNEMARVERLVKEAGTFANSLFSSLQKMEQVNLSNTANGLKAVGKEAVDSSGKVVDSSNKAASAMTRNADAIKKAATSHAVAYKKAGESAVTASKLYNNFAGSVTSLITGFASITTVMQGVNMVFQEQNQLIQQAQASMESYARVSGQLGQKATTTQELGEYRSVVNKLALTGAVENREAGTKIALAMLSAGLPVESIERLIPALQSGLMSEADLSGIIKASGPLTTFDKSLDINQLMSMAMSASRLNVSDTSKIIQAVADAGMMNKELGTQTEESFAIADVIAQSTHNADEARTWQKNFTKDIWKRVMPKYAMAKMKEIDPNAETMEGYITGYDSKGNPLIDPNFKATFSEFATWAKSYYGEDKTRLRKDFPDIRGSQGALAVMEALMDGRFDKSLASVRAARENDVVGQKAAMVWQSSPELRALVWKRAAQARADTTNEPAAMIKSLWETERTNWQTAGTSAFARGLRVAGNVSNAWLNPASYTLAGRAEQLWRSTSLTPEQRNEVIYQYALANPGITENEMGIRKHDRKAQEEHMRAGYSPSETTFATAVYNAKLQIMAGATQYTPVSDRDKYNDSAVVAVATAAENAADALNKAAAAANNVTQKLQNQVIPTPGQSGQLTPATL